MDREKEVIKLQGLMLERGDTLRAAADALKNIGVILPAPECAVLRRRRLRQTLHAVLLRLRAQNRSHVSA